MVHLKAMEQDRSMNEGFTIRAFGTIERFCRGFFHAEKVPFETADPMDLFPDLYGREIALGNLQFKWGDLPNERALIFLCMLARAEYAPIVEFGTFRGRTTYNLALNSHCKIVTIDIGESIGETIDSNANAEIHAYAKYKTGELFLDASDRIRDKIELLIGDSTKLDLSHLHNKTGLILVDGGHSYEVCLSDSNEALRLVKKGGVIVWDDYSSFWPGVKKALNELSSSIKLYYLENLNVVIHIASD